MQNRTNRRGFKPQENLISILPSIFAGIFILVTLIATILIYFPPGNIQFRVAIILYGVFGSLYLASYYFLFGVSRNKQRFSWMNAVVSGAALGVLTLLIPNDIDHLLFSLIIISAMATSLISTRGPSYFLVFSATSIYFFSRVNQHIPNPQWIIHLSLTIASVMAIETIQQLKKISREQINRLEIINELTKQIVSTLETKQVFALLNAAFQNALEADTYYIGVVNGDEIRLELFYDDGEFFHGVQTSRKGTLSNWVIIHQQELFLPDLRQGIELDDVEVVLIGKEKTSLSWMGVPMHGAQVDGIMAIGSYHPNAFDRSDMELLSTIAQRAALALDNTYHHALVAQEARLDSLTRVFNHGYFINQLNEQAEICLALNQPLSLIMLDIDHFKQCNDSFGHLVGDEILVRLCDIIRSHIKNTDAVGRWGGEEFAIALPNTDGAQAGLVAQRIQKTLETLIIQKNDQLTIPVPTVSMGIAVFPFEIKDATKLIDLADRRLYVAKERGRDQIEPVPSIPE
jgi:diguanylate cyclase (GGDEF)-like protein